MPFRGGKAEAPLTSDTGERPRFLEGRGVRRYHVNKTEWWGNYLLIVLLGVWQGAVGRDAAAPLIRLVRAWFQGGGGVGKRQERLEEGN